MFQGVNLAAGREWFEAGRTGANVVTAAQRNGAVAILSATMDALADPARVLPAAQGEALRLPTVPYTGSDAALRGREVPMVGAIEPPAWWRAGAAAPESLPAWVRASDRERRALWGACASTLERLGTTGERQFQAGAQRQSGWVGLAVAAIGVVAVVGAGLGALAIHNEAETDRVRIREDAATQRLAAQAAEVTKLYIERLQVFRATGVMPPASPAEVAVNPPAPAPGTTPPPGASPGPSQQGEAWWASLAATGKTVAAVVGASTLLTGLAAWAYSRWKRWQQMQRERLEEPRIARLEEVGS